MTLPDGACFDTVADDYDRVRPGYPAALFDDLATLTGGPGRALELGCGTGQATVGLLRTGWTVHAVERGAAMAARARANLPALTVDVTPFEQWSPGERRFDLVLSATAFHWIDPARRWSLAAAALAPGGHLALITNLTVRGGTFDAMIGAADALHRAHGAGPTSQPRTAGDLTAAARAATGIAAAWAVAEDTPDRTRQDTGADLFGPPRLRFYPRDLTYTAAQTRALMGTHSQYLLLAEDTRRSLLDGIEHLVRTEFGDTLTRRYLTVLALAPLRTAPR